MLTWFTGPAPSGKRRSKAYPKAVRLRACDQPPVGAAPFCLRLAHRCWRARPRPGAVHGKEDLEKLGVFMWPPSHANKPSQAKPSQAKPSPSLKSSERCLCSRSTEAHQRTSSSCLVSDPERPRRARPKPRIARRAAAQGRQSAKNHNKHSRRAPRPALSDSNRSPYSSRSCHWRLIGKLQSECWHSAKPGRHRNSKRL